MLGVGDFKESVLGSFRSFLNDLRRSNKLKTSWNCIKSQLRSKNVIRGHVGNSSEIIDSIQINFYEK